VLFVAVTLNVLVRINSLHQQISYLFDTASWARVGYVTLNGSYTNKYAKLHWWAVL